MHRINHCTHVQSGLSTLKLALCKQHKTFQSIWYIVQGVIPIVEYFASNQSLNSRG
jgi:hypothetical protein